MPFISSSVATFELTRLMDRFYPPDGRFMSFAVEQRLTAEEAYRRYR
jgi:hypothetical protein